MRWLSSVHGMNNVNWSLLWTHRNSAFELVPF